MPTKVGGYTSQVFHTPPGFWKNGRIEPLQKKSPAGGQMNAEGIIDIAAADRDDGGNLPVREKKSKGGLRGLHDRSCQAVYFLLLPLALSIGYFSPFILIFFSAAARRSISSRSPKRQR